MHAAALAAGIRLLSHQTVALSCARLPFRRGLAGATARAPGGDAQPGLDGFGGDAQQPAAGRSEPSFVRYRAVVSYDGTTFAGWQYQPSADTVQGRIEAVLKVRFQAYIRVAGTSRTDAGVHAKGQLIHFDVPITAGKSPSNIPASKHEWALNALLPHSIRVRDLELAPTALSKKNGDVLYWSCMHNVEGKLYSYRWQVTSFTNLASSGASPAARARAAEIAAKDHRRTVRSLEVVEEDDFGRVRLDFQLDGALYKMVRNIVGTLSEVGYGKISPSEIPALLKRLDRSRMPSPAPALGLTLERVLYSEEPTAKPAGDDLLEG
ncbi:pseudouridine synthase [Pavlovales sp. CCMP2436]|nr:pseudouridine synthase [Pavlovales sp. CCMP2436]